MQNLKERVAFLQVVAERGDFAEDAEVSRVINGILEVLSDMSDAWEELAAWKARTDEMIGELDEAVDELYEEGEWDEKEDFVPSVPPVVPLPVLSEDEHEDDDDEEDIDDDDDEDEEFLGMLCPQCQQLIYFAIDIVEDGCDLFCPHCHSYMPNPALGM